MSGRVFPHLSWKYWCFRKGLAGNLTWLGCQFITSMSTWTSPWHFSTFCLGGRWLGNLIVFSVGSGIWSEIVKFHLTKLLNPFTPKRFPIDKLNRLALDRVKSKCQWQLRELRVNSKQGKESKSISVLMKVDMNNDKK